MPGTKEGYRKWRDKMIRKLGGVQQFNNWRAKNGAKGGKNANPDNPSNFRNNRELARRAGQTKRTNVDQPDSVRLKQYRNEPGGHTQIAASDRQYKFNRELMAEKRKAKRSITK